MAPQVIVIFVRLFSVPPHADPITVDANKQPNCLTRPCDFSFLLRHSMVPISYGPDTPHPYREYNGSRGRDIFQLVLPFGPLSVNRLFREILIWGIAPLPTWSRKSGEPADPSSMRYH